MTSASGSSPASSGNFDNETNLAGQSIPTLMDKIASQLTSEGPAKAIETLVAGLRAKKLYRELFEALKMKHRTAIGLPAVALEGSPELTSEQQDHLERGLIDACREVGIAFLEEGRLEEGWMYMRPVGDRAAAAQALEKVEVTPENLESMLQVLVHEAVDVGRGTKLSLQHRGTCNTITMLESVVSMRGRKEQQAGVAELVKHVYHELLQGMLNDLHRRESKDIKADSIEQLLASRPGWLKDGTYHMDTSHLSATVRFARVLDDKDLIRKAWELSQYGRQLHPQYQYPGDEPFSDLYAMSSAFFAILLGQQIEPSLKMFLQKAEGLDVQEHGTVAIEFYADLLARIGRPNDALKFLLRKMPQGARPFGIAPSILDLSHLANDYEPMLAQSKERCDIIGYAAALMNRATM